MNNLRVFDVVQGDGLTALLLGDVRLYSFIIRVSMPVSPCWFYSQGGEEADEEEEAEEYEGQAAEKTPDIKPTPASPSKGNKRVLEAEGEENGVEQDNGAKKAKVS